VQPIAGANQAHVDCKMHVAVPAKNVDGTMDRRNFLLSAGAVSAGLLIRASASAGVPWAGNNVAIKCLGL
jgi:hypothetical protein